MSAQIKTTIMARPSLIKAFVAAKFATATALAHVAMGWWEIVTPAPTVKPAAPAAVNPASWSWTSVARAFGAQVGGQR